MNLGHLASALVIITTVSHCFLQFKMELSLALNILSPDEFICAPVFNCLLDTRYTVFYASYLYFEL